MSSSQHASGNGAIGDRQHHNGEELEQAVAERLRREFPYTRCFSRVTHRLENRQLVLCGSVPSFYLKQVLTERLRGLPGVDGIDNQVDVVSAIGLSSVRET